MAWITTKAAAQIIGVSEIRVRQLIADKRLKVQQLGRVYMVSEASARAFERGKPGRPKGAK